MDEIASDFPGPPGDESADGSIEAVDSTSEADTDADGGGVDISSDGEQPKLSVLEADDAACVHVLPASAEGIDGGEDAADSSRDGAGRVEGGLGGRKSRRRNGVERERERESSMEKRHRLEE